MHYEPRLIFNEQVQCLSRAAVSRLAATVLAAPVASEPSYMRCEIAPGHRGDLMLALCLTEAGVVPHRDVMDHRGREYFLNYPLEDMAQYRPEAAFGPAARDPRAYGTDAAMHWKGKSHIFMPCLGRNEFWVSPFPVSFHNYKDPAKLWGVHEILRGRQSCGTACPRGYVPQLAKPSATTTALAMPLSKPKQR
eukprot:gnl/TRDRNA2_/TRDRNA2_126577_c2_seq1.p1 gnl/TRDRNA2_/TRDRNA2_126577_c2~~gnl/TRDRNA2_/TRDRNA2_126577_c2_seq1.p1  ORF type:complete len:193 (+),score=16.25 gnl/TRDRNA2_/TRDRNA2_126577_c2_seq1:272-850(+)